MLKRTPKAGFQQSHSFGPVAPEGGPEGGNVGDVLQASALGLGCDMLTFSSIREHHMGTFAGQALERSIIRHHSQSLFIILRHPSALFVLVSVLVPIFVLVVVASVCIIPDHTCARLNNSSFSMIVHRFQLFLIILNLGSKF